LAAKLAVSSGDSCIVLSPSCNPWVVITAAAGTLAAKPAAPVAAGTLEPLDAEEDDELVIETSE